MKDELWAVDLIMISPHVFNVSLFVSLAKKKLARKLVFPPSVLLIMGKHNGQQP